ncbi:MAG: TrmH family RNA methyltransferase [Patescibacteria group bacterium]|nr:TrmH family RNA methyltransferase [Patescibacteria group bacterium]
MADEHLDPELVQHGDPRNVTDAFKQWTVEAIKARLASAAFPLHIAIENYQHDYNIGTIVRSANAFNVSGVHIIGKRHWNRRGAMATEKYLELYHHDSVASFQAWAQEHKCTIIGIDNIPSSQALGQTKLPPSAVYVFGQEGPGLSPELQAICSSIVAIEQFGSTRSVNVGVAAGIVLYEWLRQNDCL